MAGMSEGPEKDVEIFTMTGRLGRTSGPLGFCYHILMVNSQPQARPGLCAAQPIFGVEVKRGFRYKSNL